MSEDSSMLEKEALQATEESTEKTLGEEAPVVKEPVVEEPQPLTADQFSTALTTLTGRARKAGLRPIQMMASAYIQQGLSMIDGLLGAFDDDDEKKKKKKDQGAG